MNKVFIVYGDGGEGCGIVSTDCFATPERAAQFKTECERGDYDDGIDHDAWNTPASYRQKATEYFVYYVREYPVR